MFDPVIAVPFPETMVTVRVMMSREDPQADRGGKTTMKLLKGEADIVEKCAISVQDAGQDDGGGEVRVSWTQ